MLHDNALHKFSIEIDILLVAAALEAGSSLLTFNTMGVTVCLESLTWSAVEIEPAVGARTGHTAVCCPCQFKSHDYNNVLVFGGGDNEGKFFSDLFCISVPTSITPSVQAEILKPSDTS